MNKDRNILYCFALTRLLLIHYITGIEFLRSQSDHRQISSYFIVTVQEHRAINVLQEIIKYV